MRSFAGPLAPSFPRSPDMPPPVQKRPNLDSVTTINRDGSHFYLHPADVSGPWTKARRIAAFLLIGVYVALPWIPVNGNPALFLDVETRRFHVFGLTLVPQDLWVMFFGLTGLGFTLFFVTALLGRLWCGWACPYTVFLDHVFRRIERIIEGDAVARRKLDSAPWTAGKIARRVSKHLLYALCSAAIAHVFLSYFVSIPRLYSHMKEGPMAHATAFGVVAFLTAALWFCFGWFREQFCVLMCPYGRLQSALTDDDTVIIGYDEKRGEPRGPKGKTEGSCIDCRRCVNVCPTGIDIRNGLQLECIGCAACIDACDAVMGKMNYAPGLIRYDTENGMEHGWSRRQLWRRVLRPRVLVYATILLAASIALVGHMATRNPVKLDVIRDRGALAREVEDGMIENVYRLQIMNSSEESRSYVLSVSGLETVFIDSDTEVEVGAAGNRLVPVRVRIQPGIGEPGTHTIYFGVTDRDNPDVSVSEKTTFYVPRPR